MKTFSSMIRQNCARWILIFGLLAGLFFSGGEGIQLLPFPVSERGNSEIDVSVRDDNSKSYAFTVFSSRSFSTLLKAKFQKDTNQYLAGESLIFDRSEIGANFRLRRVRNNREANLRHVSLFTTSRSNRAPPSI